MTDNVFSGTLNPAQSMFGIFSLIHMCNGIQAVNPPPLNWGCQFAG